MLVDISASQRTPEYAHNTSRKATLNEALPVHYFPVKRVHKDVDASGSNKVCKWPQEDMAEISEDAPSTSVQCDAVDIALREDVLPEEIISDLRLRNQDLERQLNKEKAKTRPLESQISNLQTKVPRHGKEIVLFFSL